MFNTGSLLGHKQKSTTKNSKSQFEATGVRVYPNQNQSNNFINYKEVKYNLHFAHPHPTTYDTGKIYRDVHEGKVGTKVVVMAELMALLETCPA
jgi:hypothetical protein